MPATAPIGRAVKGRHRSADLSARELVNGGWEARAEAEAECIVIHWLCICFAGRYGWRRYTPERVLLNTRQLAHNSRSGPGSLNRQVGWLGIQFQRRAWPRISHTPSAPVIKNPLFGRRTDIPPIQTHSHFCLGRRGKAVYAVPIGPTLSPARSA